MTGLDLALQVEDAVRSGLPSGLQLAVAASFAVVDLDDGQLIHRWADPPGADSSWPVYCAGRVPLTLLVACDVAEGQYSYGDRISDLAPVFSGSWVGTLSLEEVLLHHPGLDGLPGVAARMMDRTALTLGICGLGAIGGDDACEVRYADYAVGHIVGEVVEAQHGCGYRDALASATGSQPGLASADPNIEARTFVDCRTDRPLLALGDCMPGNTGRWNPAYGWFATPAGLASATWSMIQRLPDAAGDLSDLVQTRRRSAWDPGLERAVELGLLGHTNYLGTSWCGLSGQGGISFCGVSLESRLVVAWAVSPALPTPWALARSARLAELFDALR